VRANKYNVFYLITMGQLW